MLSFYVWSAYILFIIIDILSLGITISNKIKYSIIVVLFLHSVISSFVKQNKIHSQASLVTIALFFAVCADYFFLFTKYSSIGILCFIAVQYVYGNLLDLRIKEKEKLISYNRIFLFLFFQTILFALFPKQFLYIVAGEYACFLLRNMFVSWHHKKKTGPFLPLAITLLFLCDCNVMLSNVTDYTIFRKIIWIFYVPSQFILEKYVKI